MAPITAPRNQAPLSKTWHRFPATLFAAALLLAGAASASAEEKAGAPFASDHNRDHPLVGTIWSTRTGKEVDENAVVEAISAADLVALGEIHDNPDHHRLQARMIDRLVGAGRHPAVVFEMITASEAPALAAFMARPDRNAAGFGPAVQWTARGWPDWAIYQPIAEAILAHDLPARAGDLAKDMQRKVGREGIEALPEAFRARSGLETPLDAAQEDGLLTVLEDSHCRLVPKAGLTPMLGVQRARDASLADALLAAGKEAGTAVLVTGDGHIRRDWAVPFYVGLRDPQKTVVTVAFLEVDPERGDAMAYLPQSASGKPVYDFLWFTPRANITDHCAELRERFSKDKKTPAGKAD